MPANDPQDILDFWFPPRARALWFASTPEWDAEIRARHEPLWQRACRGELEAWMDSAEGALALVILLDQFPLNMFRGQATAFAGEGRAVAACKRALELGFHHDLDEARRLFLFMPLMHSENPQDQDLSLQLFEAAGMDTRWPRHHRGMDTRWPRQHRDLVRRSGRIPHRNAILGRPSTAPELDDLASDEAFKG
jgi:uncharacterized protein (DUF924 family)